jgi:hypothetical protein
VLVATAADADVVEVVEEIIGALRVRWDGRNSSAAQQCTNY